MIIFKIRLLKLTGIDHTKKIELLSLLKKLLRENWKKNLPLVYPVLRYTRKKIKFCLQNKTFLEKIIEEVRNSICAGKKNQKNFRGNFKIILRIFCVAIKKIQS